MLLCLVNTYTVTALVEAMRQTLMMANSPLDVELQRSIHLIIIEHSLPVATLVVHYVLKGNDLQRVKILVNA